jgi:hypothetical protein
VRHGTCFRRGLSAAMQVPRRTPRSLSLGSFGYLSHLLADNLAMTSRNLSPPARAAILEQIRTFTGPEEYDRLVAGCGEDALVEAVLSNNQFGAATPAPKKTLTPSQVLTALLASLLFPLYWMSWNWLGSVAGFLLSLASLVSWVVIYGLMGGHTTAAVIVYVVLVVVFFLVLTASANATKE